jgi:hypothetical protein
VWTIDPEKQYTPSKSAQFLSDALLALIMCLPLRACPCINQEHQQTSEPMAQLAFLFVHARLPRGFEVTLPPSHVSSHALYYNLSFSGTKGESCG